MEGHTEVAPLKFDDQLPCQFCNFQSVCHVDTIIDSKHYRHVDETMIHQSNTRCRVRKR